MHVRNVHERHFAASPAEVGALLDGLASTTDRLWPRRWPRMRFDRPLVVGASGGHGPIGYDIEAYESSRRIRFRLRRPRGFDGYHEFEVVPDRNGATLRHALEMKARGVAIITWPLVIAPLHDALIEDCLDSAASALNEAPHRKRWSPRVRFLRALFRIFTSSSRRTNPQSV